MALKSGLVLNCYTLPTSQSGQNPLSISYADELDGVSFTTLAPGGFGQLTATIRLTAINALLPQPQLSFGAQVALMDGLFCAFRGEVMGSSYVVNANGGDAYQITALGIGNQLRDDPYDVTYSNKTAQQIVVSELTRHSGGLLNLPNISQDTSQIFPDNPAGTSSPAYDGRNIEEITADQATLAGIYDWFVWDHPTQRDAAGFAPGQLSVTLHDANTTHYRATMADRDIQQGQIVVSGDRAYNYIEVDYNAASTTNGTQKAVSQDTRLDPVTLAQGTAPFRFRKYRRDVSGTSTIGSSQAHSVSGALLSEMENLTNKVNLTLFSIKDAQGNPIDLWRVRAGKNIFVPDLAARAQQLALTASATLNQFFIVQTTYTETTTGASLQIQADNFEDYGERQIDRLMLAADQQSRGQKFASLMQMLGAPVNGSCGFRFLATAAAQNGGGTVTFPTILYQVPTSISHNFDVVVNATNATFTNLSTFRFILGFQSIAAGDCQVSGTYTTAGNTIRRLDERRGKLDWHCDVCDTVHEGLSTRKAVTVIHTHPTGKFVPGWTGMKIACPNGCKEEHFNTALTAEHEDGRRFGEVHAEHAVMIRRLMRHLGMGTG